jgi:hypothetical protein
VADELPILVERFSSAQAKRLACEHGCGFERDATGDEIASGAHEYGIGCRCGGVLIYKYEEAQKCANCGRLGWWQTPYGDGTCSRACHLQVEYAKELARG